MICGVVFAACGLLPDAERDSANELLDQIVDHSHATVDSRTWYPQDGGEAHLEAVIEPGDTPSEKVLDITGRLPSSTLTPDMIALRDPNNQNATCEVYRITESSERQGFGSVKPGQVGLDIICGLLR